MPYKNKNAQRKYQQNYYQNTKALVARRNRTKRQLNREFVASVKAGWVCKCGESDPVCVDFHHRNPDEKELRIAQAIKYSTLEDLKKEISKCDMICANCHRKIHRKLSP